jgi:hypothetical protein
MTHPERALTLAHYLDKGTVIGGKVLLQGSSKKKNYLDAVQKVPKML